MSADRITYDSTDKVFVFDEQAGFDGSMVLDGGALHVIDLASGGSFQLFTSDVIGKVIAAALMEGTNQVQFDTIKVSVNYLLQMLRFTGKHGWFSDILSSTSDHAFDPNNPTPGLFVGEARKLTEAAAQLDSYARLARTAHRYDEAHQAQSQAEEHRATVRRLLTQQ